MTRLSAALLLAACTAPGTSGPALPSARVVTFNTGTTPTMGHDQPPDDGYTGAMAAVSDEVYGDGLAWNPAIDAVTAWFADNPADLVGFQELFHSDDCAGIEADPTLDFVCRDWQPGDPPTALAVLPDGFQVACHPGKNDKCVAVNTAFARFEDCEEPGMCGGALQGEGVDGCGSGARVAWANLVVTHPDLRGAHETIRVVHMHGSSGLSADDQACRVAQLDQVFGDDGALTVPGILLGDFNTDPSRFVDFDASAAAFADGLEEAPAVLHTQRPEDATPTYSGLADIDHIASRMYDLATCAHPGVDGAAPVIEATYFDHGPVWCELEAWPDVVPY